jgi:hypothetical protein
MTVSAEDAGFQTTCPRSEAPGSVWSQGKKGLVQVPGVSPGTTHLVPQLFATRGNWAIFRFVGS